MALEAIQCLGGQRLTSTIFPGGRLCAHAQALRDRRRTREIRRMLIGREIFEKTE